MADTLTTGFGLIKPEVGASTDTWGTKINANLDIIDDVLSGARAAFPNVLAATTANITLAGEQTIDGVLTSASRILVKDQTTTANNGIYITAAGAWIRALDANSVAEFVLGRAVYVQSGTIGGGREYRLTSSVISLGTSPVTFSDAIKQGVVTASSFIGTLTGNASTASTLQTARAINLGGDLSGSVLFNGGADVTLNGQVTDDSHLHGAATIAGAFNAGGLQSLSQNGYQRFPGGLIIQWATGISQTAEAQQAISFPIAFPNGVFCTVVSTVNPSGGTNAAFDNWFEEVSRSNSSITVLLQGVSLGGAKTPRIIAIGF